MNLTPEQEQAVTERGRDVIVTAGAGSGKTRVLVERYVGLLKDHQIDQLVAVTFTEAAAAEMRGRVREAVMADSDMSAHRQNLDRAIIGTIHSLCLQLLRENPVESGIDPGATVLDENLAQAEILAACRDAIEAAASGEEEGAEAILRLGPYSTRLTLPRMVERRDEIERAFEAMGGDTPREWEVHVKRTLDKFLEPRAAELRGSLAEHREFLANAQNPGESDTLTPTVTDVLEALKDPLSGTTEDLVERLRLAAEIESPGGRGTRGAWAYPPKEVRDSVRAIREAHKSLAPFIWNEADAEAMTVLGALRELFRNAVRRYEDKKREQSALDFLDLELKAIELLKAHPGVAASYRSTFRHVLVDEAQDLNPTQDLFLRLLAGVGVEADIARPERFFVGDIKQSIFRFRRSDVRNLNRLKDEVWLQSGAMVALSTSYRSHRRLVEATNKVMEGVFGEPEADYEARMEPMEAVRPSAGSKASVEVLQVAREFKEPDDESKPTGPQRTRMEAHIVAGRIRQLIDERREIWDKGDKEYRLIEPGDIVILLRRMTNVNEYERALEHHGIPYRTTSGGNFYRREEIVDLTNMLEWLAEPANSIALIGLLRSPFFVIDDESLISLTESARSARKDSRAPLESSHILASLRNPPAGVRQETRQLCLHAARALDQLREESRLATPEQLLESALILTNYEASWAPLRGGDQALANIRQFVGLARGLGELSVDEFVQHIQMLRDELEARAPQAALDAVDAVRILTVHSAKGLEFPVVFIGDAGTTRVGPPPPPVLWNAETGISMTLERDVSEIDEPRSRPALYNFLRERDDLEDAAERKRLLYVAVTRAADLLVVSGVEPSGDTPTWLGAFLDNNNDLDIHVHNPTPVDLEAMRRNPPAQQFMVPKSEDEHEADTPLLGRHGAIPIRSSTPATALEDGHGVGFSGRPDRLALTRGTLAHAAIEEWFKTENRPDLRDLARSIGARLSDEDLNDVVADINAMLDDFDTSDLAATLRDPATRKHFELPFSWAWDGVAVHGSIDLAYETEGEWHVVDFKTDRVEKGREADRATAYLTQLGVYAGALEAATGRRPKAGLMFLRMRTLHWVSESDISAALRETRKKIDGGEIALAETDANGEFADELLYV